MHGINVVFAKADTPALLMCESRSVLLGKTYSSSEPSRRSSHSSKLVREASRDLNWTCRPVF